MYNSNNNNEKGVSLLIYYKVFLIFLILKGCQEGIGDAKNVAVTVDKEVLERESRIYGRSENRTLSKYEETINRCALACCEEDVSLLKDRKKLFNLAREKADSEGYSYKKQRSRSKVMKKWTRKLQNVRSWCATNVSDELRSWWRIWKVPQIP